MSVWRSAFYGVTFVCPVASFCAGAIAPPPPKVSRCAVEFDISPESIVGATKVLEAKPVHPAAAYFKLVPSLSRLWEVGVPPALPQYQCPHSSLEQNATPEDPISVAFQEYRSQPSSLIPPASVCMQPPKAEGGDVDPLDYAALYRQLVEAAAQRGASPGPDNGGALSSQPTEDASASQQDMQGVLDWLRQASQLFSPTPPSSQPLPSQSSAGT